MTFLLRADMLVAGFSDGTMLVFDVAKFHPRRALATKLSEGDLELLWVDLAADARRAHPSTWRLVDAPVDVLPFLRNHCER